MIYLSKDGHELHVDCSCGCGEGLTFKLDPDPDDDSYFYQFFCRGTWYTDQETPGTIIGKKLKRIWAVIRGKDYYYGEIVMSKDDARTMAHYLLKEVGDE